jgi:hypothetical protein
VLDVYLQYLIYIMSIYVALFACVSTIIEIIATINVQSIHNDSIFLTIGAFNIDILIQVDISGHPPFLTGSKQFSGNFGNLLFLVGFNFRGHFEGLNEGFLRSRFSMIAKGMIEPPK